MTVADLIEQLQKCAPQKVVFVENPGHAAVPIKGVRELLTSVTVK